MVIMYIRRDHAQKYELGVNIIFDSLTLFYYVAITRSCHLWKKLYEDSKKANINDNIYGISKIQFI